jgi:hypothetical protein
MVAGMLQRSPIFLMVPCRILPGLDMLSVLRRRLTVHGLSFAVWQADFLRAMGDWAAAAAQVARTG